MPAFASLNLLPFCDLPPLEQAKRIHDLLYNKQQSMESVCQHTGLAIHAINRKLELLTLPPHILSRLEADNISEEKAHQLARDFRATEKLNSYPTQQPPSEPTGEPATSKLRVPTPQEFKELPPLEKARILKRIKNELDLKWKEVAAMLGIHQQTIYGLLDLLDLPKDLQVQVERGELSATHARIEGRKREADTIQERQVKPGRPPTKKSQPTQTTVNPAAPEPNATGEPVPPTVAVALPVLHVAVQPEAITVPQHQPVLIKLFISMLALADSRSLDEAMTHAAMVLPVFSGLNREGVLNEDGVDLMTEMLANVLHLSPSELIELSLLEHQAQQARQHDARAAYKRTLDLACKKAHA